MSDFIEGQQYINGLGRQLTILAVDDVPTVRRDSVTVLAYRYDDNGVVHLRAAHETEGWERL